MIFIDNVKVDLKSPEGSKIEKVVKRHIDEIKKSYKGRFPLVIRYGQHLAYKQEVEQGGQSFVVEKYPPQRTMKLTSQVVIDGVKVNVRWANTENDGKYYPEKEQFKGKMNISEIDADKAFYFLYCYPNIDGGLESSDIQKIEATNNTPDFAFIDSHRENRMELDYIKTRARVENAITNEMDDDAIKVAAINYSLSGATTKPSNVLRAELVRLLAIKAETTKDKVAVYQDFTLKCEKFLANKDNLETKIRALIQKAQEGKYIRHSKINGSANTFEWMYMNPKSGARGKRIYETMPDKSPIESLVTYLLENEQARFELEKYYDEQTKN